MIKNYYHLLSLSREATPLEIKQAYRLFATKYHPDKHGGDRFFEEKFKEINEAYEVLSHAEQKKKYDSKLFGNSGSNDFTKSTYNKTSSSQSSNRTSSQKTQESAKSGNNYRKRKEGFVRPKKNPEILESRKKNFQIGLGTAFMVFFLSLFGKYGFHIPFLMIFLFWTIRQIFVVLATFLPD
jgi:DnaJ-class molecular chaperone